MPEVIKNWDRTQSTVQGDRQVLIALQQYMLKIEDGILVHGPLLAWAQVMGDDVKPFSTTSASGERGPVYMMPFRKGLSFGDYPWATHGTP